MLFRSLRAHSPALHRLAQEANLRLKKLLPAPILKFPYLRNSMQFHLPICQTLLALTLKFPYRGNSTPFRLLICANSRGKGSEELGKQR